MNAPTIESEIREWATVEEVHEHDENADSAFAVVFRTQTVPKSFQSKLLSEGYCVSTIDSEDELVAVFTDITDF